MWAKKKDIFCGSDRRSEVYVEHKSGYTNAIRQTGLWQNAGAERSYENDDLSANVLEIKQYMRRVKDDARVSNCSNVGLFKGFRSRSVIGLIRRFGRTYRLHPCGD